MTTSPITVLLADDHMFLREGLCALLDFEADIKVIGEAENGRQAVAFAARLQPDVVVMDIAMPLLNGLEAARRILNANAAAHVIILSAHGDDRYVERAMALGAAGYLVKQTASHALPEAIREVHKGKRFFSPSVSMRRDHLQRASGDPPQNDAPKLSSREMEVLQLVAEGKANKEMASEMNISIKTVEKHRQQVRNKLNIHNTASFTRYAIAAGIIESSVQATTESSNGMIVRSE